MWTAPYEISLIDGNSCILYEVATIDSTHAHVNQGQVQVQLRRSRVVPELPQNFTELPGFLEVQIRVLPGPAEVYYVVEKNTQCLLIKNYYLSFQPL